LIVVDEGASNVEELKQLSLQYFSQIQTMVSQNEKLVEFIDSTQKLTNEPAPTTSKGATTSK